MTSYKLFHIPTGTFRGTAVEMPSYQARGKNACIQHYESGLSYRWVESFDTMPTDTDLDNILVKVAIFGLLLTCLNVVV